MTIVNMQDVIQKNPQTADYRLLHIGRRQVVFSFVKNSALQHAITLNTGTGQIAVDFFRSEIPGEAEVENAINFIEDELMAHADIRNKKEKLYNADAFLAEHFHVTTSAPRQLSIQTVEDEFTQYALLSMGRSPALSSVQMDKEKYAGILILREILHHLDFTAVTVLNPAQ